MKSFGTSYRLIDNISAFLKIHYYTIFDRLFCRSGIFYGWGRKQSGQQAIKLAQKCGTSYVLLEDGFIRSLGLGVENSPSFSIIEDDLGIYYDATVPSKLENILNSYSFGHDIKLMQTARYALSLMKKYHISKYNYTPSDDDRLLQLKLHSDHKNGKQILIIAQTSGDSSLEYGMLKNYTTAFLIQTALGENPDAKVYLKIHPDVISDKKSSDIDINAIDKKIQIITDDFNPISLLKYFDKVYTKTSQMGFEALLLGKECVCFGMPFYAGWGLTDDRVSCERRNRKLSVEEVFAGAYILYSRYYNPCKQQPSDIIDTIKTIIHYRDIELANNGRLFYFGFSAWKRGFIKPFFVAKKNEIYFCDNLQDAIMNGFSSGDKALIWGMKDYDDIVLFCESHDTPIFRVEDGFIRSVSLGSDLTRPYSLVIDSRGIYFDPNKPSDLEYLLLTYEFDEEIKNRAKNLRSKIISSKFSKYNSFSHKKLSVDARLGQKIILIPGQVEDDASILLGGFGMNTVKLLQETRANNTSAYIIFKPHPDVLSGNRIGLNDTNIIMQYCDEMIKEASIDSCLEICDEVHTLTSTVGFDALLRGKKVYTYGMPFYAGWGITSDKFINNRRSKVLELDELVAGALILYPRYISPKTHTLCDVEVAFDEMIDMQKRYFEVAWFRILMDTKTFILRKLRRTIEFVLGNVGQR